jgi:hypothetical protein
MIVAIFLLVLITAVSLASLAVLAWRDVRDDQRAEQANIERQKRWAERRLHDISSQAFGQMLDATRQPSRGDRPWWS